MSNPEPDYTILCSRADVLAVIRLARMSRHLAEDPATDRLAALCERLPQPDCPEYAAEFTAPCGHEYVLGGVAYGCERAPHPTDGYGPPFRHAAGIDAEMAEGTDEGDGHGPATLVTWGEDGKGDGHDWAIGWGTVADAPAAEDEPGAAPWMP